MLCTVGLVIGLLLVALVALFTYCSARVIADVAAGSHLETYGAIIRERFGPTGCRLLQLSIILHVAGEPNAAADTRTGAS